jgi:hypothetical protein
MNGRGVCDGDMPILPWSVRGGVPPVGHAAYDALLDGHPVAEDVAEGLRPVAEAIAALNGEPETRELDAEASALAVFRGGVGMSAEPVRSRHRRRSLLASVLSAKLAAAIAAAAVTVGGVAAAAYAGALPAPMQKLAHDTLGAPSAHPAHSAVPVGPSATGNAAYGLCTAYAHLPAHGSAKQKAVAFRNLAAAAGGAANVAAYCAKVAHPGTTPAGEPGTHPTGKPTAPPSQAPASHPTGEPGTHPTGKPTAPPSQAPASHPTGEPGTHPTGKPTNSP